MLEFFLILLGKGWLWDRCGICGHPIWLRKKRVHSVKFRSRDNEYVWITLPICLLCSIDLSRMEKDAEWRKRTN